MTIRLAFIGCGNINHVHATAARQIHGVELAAVVNHQAESMEKFADTFSIPRTYLAVEDLIADGDIDAVIIATPNQLHARQSILALQAGIHVLVEKPMAMNAVEARAMLAAAVDHRKTLMVAHCWRYEPQVRWLGRQLSSGKIGSIVRTKGYNRHIAWGPEGWFTQKKLAGGGAMADLGVHSIDTARFLLGDPLPLSIFARTGTFYHSMDVDDTATVFINWDNGSYSLIESGWWQPESDDEYTSALVFGTQGYGRIFPPQIRKGSEIEQPALTPEPDWEEMYQIQMAAFMEQILSADHSITSARNGLINMMMVDAAYESARTGRLVMFEESGND